MKLCHLTDVESLDSILKKGLIPQKIIISEHWDILREQGLEKRKCVYLWKSNDKLDDKYVGDMIYCKQILTPRNTLISKVGFDFLQSNFISFPESIKRDKVYVLLYIDSDKISKDDIIYKVSHLQKAENTDPWNALYDVPSEYSHDDKEVVITKTKIHRDLITIGNMYKAIWEANCLKVIKDPG